MTEGVKLLNAIQDVYLADDITVEADSGGHTDNRPLVVRLDGNNAEEGRRILDDAGHNLVRRVDTMDGAARLAAELASQGV